MVAEVSNTSSSLGVLMLLVVKTEKKNLLNKVALSRSSDATVLSHETDGGKVLDFLCKSNYDKQSCISFDS